jgi:hypothetical protein
LAINITLKVVLPEKMDTKLARLVAQWTPQDPRGVRHRL